MKFNIIDKIIFAVVLDVIISTVFDIAFSNLQRVSFDLQPIQLNFFSLSMKKLSYKSLTVINELVNSWSSSHSGGLSLSIICHFHHRAIHNICYTLIHYRFVGHIEIQSNADNYKADTCQGVAVEYLTAKQKRAG